MNQAVAAHRAEISTGCWCLIMTSSPGHNDVIFWCIIITSQVTMEVTMEVTIVVTIVVAVLTHTRTALHGLAKATVDTREFRNIFF